jgi:hypothetical protein
MIETKEISKDESVSGHLKAKGYCGHLAVLDEALTAADEDTGHHANTPNSYLLSHYVIALILDPGQG